MNSISLLKEFLDEHDIWSRTTNSYYNNKVRKLLVLDSMHLEFEFDYNGYLYGRSRSYNDNDDNYSMPVANISDPDFFNKVIKFIGD